MVILQQTWWFSLDFVLGKWMNMEILQKNLDFMGFHRPNLGNHHRKDLDETSPVTDADSSEDRCHEAVDRVDRMGIHLPI